MAVDNVPIDSHSNSEKATGNRKLSFVLMGGEEARIDQTTEQNYLFDENIR